MKTSIIVAIDKNNVIGSGNKMLWHLPADLKHFKELTTNHHVLMGRKTFESIGKVLPNRTNIILSSSIINNKDNLYVFNNDIEALKFAYNNGETELFIIGGGEIYKYFINSVDKLYITEVDTEVQGDVYFPKIDYSKWELIERQSFKADEKNCFNYSFSVFERKF